MKVRFREQHSGVKGSSVGNWLPRFWKGSRAKHRMRADQQQQESLATSQLGTCAGYYQTRSSSGEAMEQSWDHRALSWESGLWRKQPLPEMPPDDRVGGGNDPEAFPMPAVQ